MRRIISTLVVSGTLVVGTPTAPAGDGLIVHEWGTFTSFSGSDGVRLEFRPLVEEDLPPFVLDRFLQSGQVNLGKSRVRVRMRMETPITYFYTDRELDVNVRVSFPEGLLTEFYPPVAQIEPPYVLGEKLALKRSALDWGRIHLIPTDRLRADVADPERRRVLESLLPLGLVPPSDSKFHYGHARDTDSALVHVHRLKPPATFESALAPAGDFFEKFLFYRGVGNFELPLTLTSAGENRFELTNSGKLPIRSLFLIDGDAQNVRFTAFPQIDAGERRPLVQTGRYGNAEALADAVKYALAKEGLYEREALAMVKTWRASWFNESGTRLLYILPQSLTDAILPLDIEPKPRETLRVLVGRMEIMTPEQELRATKIVQTSAAARQATFVAARAAGKRTAYPLPRDLAELGRLTEPALARVSSTSKDPAVRKEALLLLEQLTGVTR